jgi:phenylacetate-CoA ligase
MTMLGEIPPLSRIELRDQFDALLREDYSGRIRYVSTGGTTGTPVRVAQDAGFGRIEGMLVNHRMFSSMGRTLGTPMLLIAGSPIDARRWATIGARVKNAVFRVVVVPAFQLDERGLERLVRLIRSGRFPLVAGYSSVFDILTKWCVAQKTRLRIQRIVAGAELVTMAQRQAWSECFGAEVFEIFGSREMGSIAGETPEHIGMLVNGDLYVVEILEGNGLRVPDGEPGLVTVTTLAERAMPLIRYQLGDIGTLTGLPGSRYLRITHGRVLDVIKTPGGKWLPGEFFPHLFKEVSEQVRQFQVTQVARDELVIRVVPTSRWDSGTNAYVVRKVLECVGEEMKVDVRLVDAIPASASGKFRPTINMVSS